jgi:hypothetical protein
MVRNLKLDRRWLSFKRERLLHELEVSLIEHDVTLADEKVLRAATTEHVEHQQDFATNKRERLLDEGDIKKAILKVVGELPLSELRSLRLPVGEVIDAIIQHR